MKSADRAFYVSEVLNIKKALNRSLNKHGQVRQREDIKPSGKAEFV